MNMYDNELLEKMKQAVKGITEKDFEITEDILRKYELRKKDKTILDMRVKGIVECPACYKVYNLS